MNESRDEPRDEARDEARDAARYRSRDEARGSRYESKEYGSGQSKKPVAQELQGLQRNKFVDWPNYDFDIGQSTPPSGRGSRSRRSSSPQLFSRPDDYTEEDMSEAMVAAGRTELFYTVNKYGDDRTPLACILSLGTLQRMHIHALQLKLSKQAERLLDDPGKLISQSDEMRKDLREYCQAIRDMDLMKSHATLDIEDDPFQISSINTLQRQALTAANLATSGRMNTRHALPLCKDADHAKLWGSSRTVAHKKLVQQQSVKRFLYALGGGLALIAPMLIMIYVPGRTASVATTCVFMVAFALVIAVRSDMKPNEVLAVTSAYAAVLVVFVGVRLEDLSGP